MANILDYLDWRGDLTLAQDPFNEVDNLILAELSFVDFGGIVPGPGEGRAVPLWKAAEAYFAKTEGRPIDMGVLVPNQIPELLRRTASSPRFRDMKLNGFVDPSGHGEGGAVRGAGGRVQGWHRLPLLPGHRRYAGRVERGFLSELYAGGPCSANGSGIHGGHGPSVPPDQAAAGRPFQGRQSGSVGGGVLSHGGAAADRRRLVQ